MPSFIIVGEDTDLLSKSSEKILRDLDIDVFCTTPGNLGNLGVTLRSGHYMVEGHSIGGILFRTSPDGNFSSDFIPEDRSFCDSEVKATWLAALHADSVVTVNKYDATSWFEGASWPVWRRLLLHGGVSIPTFLFGNQKCEGKWLWHPYRSNLIRPAPGPNARKVLGTALSKCHQVQFSLIVCSRVIAGVQNSSTKAVAELLQKVGVRIAEIGLDSHQSIVSVNTLPHIGDELLAKKAAAIIVGEMLANSSHW